jgi:acetoin utilization deacetylase AcuC-like enzyme
VRVHTDPRCLEHEVPPGFPERPERLRGILDALATDPRFELVERPAVDDAQTLAAVRALHEPRYVERFERAVARGDGLIDTADNPIAAGSWRAALGAAAATLDALDAALDGTPAFAAVRPPGHHAERGQAMGFCFFGNAALAAERALRRHGFARVAIVDVDVHHGNGTQHLFEERADVFYASLHQYPFYPGTGGAEERGRGAGEGCTLNVPLPAGAGDAEWRSALVERVLPALARYAPEALIVSAGFDAWRADPLGGMRVTEDGFAELGRLLRAAAAERCGGRMLTVLEGGYDLAALPRLARDFLVE